MVSYIISLKENASEDELEKAKQKVLDQGGRITQEFTLIKGFAVEFDDDVVLQLSSNESINVEEDKEVTIS